MKRKYPSFNNTFSRKTMTKNQKQDCQPFCTIQLYIPFIQYANPPKKLTNKFLNFSNYVSSIIIQCSSLSICNHRFHCVKRIHHFTNSKYQCLRPMTNQNTIFAINTILFWSQCLRDNTCCP